VTLLVVVVAAAGEVVAVHRHCLASPLAAAEEGLEEAGLRRSLIFFLFMPSLLNQQVGQEGE
jgi:hypothetical protein